MTSELVLAAVPPESMEGEPAALTSRQGCGRWSSMESPHSKRNYARALDDLFNFCASRPLSWALLMEWRAAMETDVWMNEAGIKDGRLLHAVSKSGEVNRDTLSDRAVWL
jgi:hypothetical protein